MPYPSLFSPYSRTRLYRDLGLTLAFSSAFSLPLAAQESGIEVDATTLDRVEVTAPIARESGTATRTGTRIAEIPQSISVITDRQMRDRGIHGVEEAVWFTAGAQGGGYGTDSRSDWLLVRGFTPARYMDGLALPEGSGTGITRIEPYGLERVEVLKGPASVNYGAMPPGGLVNYVSKRPVEAPLHEVEAQVGSDDMRQLAFDFGGPLNDSGTLLYRLTGLARNSDTSVDYIHDDRYFLAPALTWKPDDANSFTVLARYQKADTKSGAGFLPAEGTLLPNPNGRIPTNRFTGEPNANDYVKTLKSLGYGFQHDFGAGTIFQQSLRYGTAEVDPNVAVGAFGLLADQRNLFRYLWSTREDEKTLGVDNNLQWHFGDRVQHTLLAGLDYRRSRYSYDSNFVFAATSLDVFNPVYGSMPDLAPDFDPATTAGTRQTQSQVGLYVQDQMKIDRWVVTVGGRQDWVGTDSNGSHQSDDKFSARVGVNYLFDNGFAPYVGWSQSFQATIGTEHPDRGGSAFVPTSGEQVELGLKYQPAGGNLLATLALYQITQENTLTVDPEHTLFQIQQGETRVRGAELEGRWNVGRGLSLYGAYAYIDSEVTKTTVADTLGKQIALQPRHAASAGGDYTITEGALSGLGFGAGVRYTGEHYGDAPNLWRTPSYTVFDAAVHYDFGNWRLQLNAQNVTDKEYISACNAVYWCYYGYARNVTATARYQW
ncbi:TonB-dependent siderophore receptor [Pseudoxanthomonas yeongjuensis]|uniref:TonB-dependent siderophore receptor n=1 Tax=Pseudoxanthomonas yeongjuensis TaxID=377616 RepID=UPI0013909770|nr:TonB-dependent siderophore receptor [Pseudoxanthomonas yeongjuensis]KAF1717575.1 TonB-dependent siderophore receptor [Pseudoxanthomonas yeongjuensis]